MNTLVAVTPTDLGPARTSLLEYIGQRITALATEFSEASTELLYAKSHKWRTKPLEAVCNKIARRQTFYEKLRAAVEAGYVIVPSLQMTVLAIRTKATGPRETSNNGTWNNFEQQAQTLPSGAGEYRNPIPTQDSYTEESKNSKGEAITKEIAFPVAFEDEFSMPVELCKPRLLKRTEQAMALKVFDEIGVIQDNHSYNRRGDPIIVGTVIDPTRRGRRFSFFIAWALPIDEL
jgi:hypothetical protein